MSAVLRSASKACIIALPLTTGSPTAGPSTYYHFHMPKPRADKEGWFHKATTKASNAWSALGKAPEGNWKRTMFNYGERVMDTVNFEEIALQSVDPPLGFNDPKPSGEIAEKEWRDRFTIPFFYPSIYSMSPLLELTEQVKNRKPIHRRGLIIWGTAIPVLAPLGILPIIPNLPCYYAIWRAWSHYRALKASEYLDTVLSRSVVIPSLDPDIDGIYHKYGAPLQPPAATHPEGTERETTSEKSNVQNHDRIMIRREAIPALVDHFDLPPSAATNLYRAYDQTVKRLTKTARQSYA